MTGTSSHNGDEVLEKLKEKPAKEADLKTRRANESSLFYFTE